MRTPKSAAMPSVCLPGFRRGSFLVRGVVFAAVALVLGRMLSLADLRGAVTLLAGIGPKIVFALIPFALTMAVDALVQWALLHRLGQPARYRPLYLIRLITEALTMSLPGGVVFAETAGPMLLKRHCGVAIEAGLVANATKRWLTIRAHAAYIGLSAALGYGVLTRISPALRTGQSLVYIVVALALGLMAVSVAIGAVLTGRAWPQRAALRLRALPIPRLRSWLDKKQACVAALDERFARLTQAGGTLWTATALLFSAWILESVETWFILRLLGAPIGFADVIAFEAGLSFLRSAAFFVPAGLGVQDLGYLAFLSALGLPGASAVGAAFVVLKRAKEATWIVVGWLIAGGFALSRSHANVRPVSLPEEALS